MFHPFEYAGPLRIPPPKYQVRVRKEALTRDTINARQFEVMQTDAPIQQSEYIRTPGAGMGLDKKTKAVAYDMAPLSSRTDKRDYRQAQPFVADGPSLAMNPYFDRYDPTRDPRNAIRELRGVVYEEKEADRGLAESKRITARGYATRWETDEGVQKEMVGALQAYERMKPVLNDMGVDYRQVGPAGPSGPSGAS